MKKLLLVALLVCAPAAAQNQAQIDAMLVRYGNGCANFYDIGSEKWKQCVMEQIADELPRQRPSLLESFAAGLSAAGRAMSPQVYQSNNRGPAPPLHPL